MGEHLALYRKYRPQTFEDVVGQEHVVAALEGAIKQKSFAHAYLFSGGRGTGKTSVARIFAHAIGVDAADLYEIDAASNRGIDDVRELRDGVSALPMRSPYKLYLIDEVHMLTKEAFNALLKTLEEPPQHVVFVLATTELDRVPDTIVSRCQTFSFKKPTQAMLCEIILDIAKKEKREIEPAAADLLAILGDGSFRDAEGMLQKVLAVNKGKKITLAHAEATTGAPRATLVNDFIRALQGADIEKALAVVATAAEQNIDMQVLLRLILQKVRIIMLLVHAPRVATPMLEQLTQEDATFLKELAEVKPLRLTADTLAALLDAYMETRRAAIPELPLELALIDIIKHPDR